MEATRIVLSEHERSTLERRRRRRLIARADATRAEIVLLAAELQQQRRRVGPRHHAHDRAVAARTICQGEA
jgi:hypothetical protein